MDGGRLQNDDVFSFCQNFEGKMFDANGFKFLRRLNEVNLRFIDFKPIRIGENLDSGEL